MKRFRFSMDFQAGKFRDVFHVEDLFSTQRSSTWRNPSSLESQFSREIHVLTQRYVWWVVASFYQVKIAGAGKARESTVNTFIRFHNSSQNMKFTIAILSLTATASAFTPSVSRTRSVARTVGGGSSVLAPVPVRASGT